ncbi:MAG: hypothetical protein QOG59_1180 [Solirubrobacteraceae bacterium]|nr:hypothetical protein [Solirubrobacteraceae bacterium]
MPPPPATATRAPASPSQSDTGRGGEALRHCLPEDLFELYLETSLLQRLCIAARSETELVAAIGAFEADMREYTYPFMRMAMEHDQNFGGGGLKRLRETTSNA